MLRVSRAAFFVGQDAILRADWQSARNLSSCPTDDAIKPLVASS